MRINPGLYIITIAQRCLDAFDAKDEDNFYLYWFMELEENDAFLASTLASLMYEMTDLLNAQLDIRKFLVDLIEGAKSDS